MWPEIPQILLLLRLCSYDNRQSWWGYFLLQEAPQIAPTCSIIQLSLSLSLSLSLNPRFKLCCCSINQNFIQITLDPANTQNYVGYTIKMASGVFTMTNCPIMTTSTTSLTTTCIEEADFLPSFSIIISLDSTLTLDICPQGRALKRFMWVLELAVEMLAINGV